MSYSISNIFTVACVATALVLSTGCADVPDENENIMIMDVENAVDEELAPVNLSVVETDHRIIEANEDLKINHGLREEAQPVFDVDLEPHVEVDSEGIDQFEEPEFDALPNDEFAADFGRSDVSCAPNREWKNFASSVCLQFESKLTGYEPNAHCSGADYAGATYICSELDENLEPVNHRKIMSFILGGRGVCKDFATFQNFAHEICGTTAEIVEKKPLTSCESGGSASMFQTVRFTCEIM